jgi:hypothetical protein
MVAINVCLVRPSGVARRLHEWGGCPKQTKAYCWLTTSGGLRQRGKPKIVTCDACAAMQSRPFEQDATK